MRRLLAATLLAAAAFAPAAAHADHYWRECGGAVDYDCRGGVCRMDCFPEQDCQLWVNLLHDRQTAMCVTPVAG